MVKKNKYSCFLQTTKVSPKKAMSTLFLCFTKKALRSTIVLEMFIFFFEILPVFLQLLPVKIEFEKNLTIMTSYVLHKLTNGIFRNNSKNSLN